MEENPGVLSDQQDAIAQQEAVEQKYAVEQPVLQEEEKSSWTHLTEFATRYHRALRAATATGIVLAISLSACSIYRRKK